MKTKILFLTTLLSLAPTFCTVFYGQSLFGAIKDAIIGRVNNSKSSSDNKNKEVEKNEVTLIVSGDGETKDQAVNTALRSAIEQAYGTFVSANTIILNDELTKDEIVTVSNGNIKSYKELSSMIIDNKIYVTIEATVSISNLISYAQSKGASAEFAGATFARNVKLQEFYKKNEEMALDNLLIQMKSMLPSCYDLEIEIKEPKGSNFKNYYEVEMIISFIPNKNAQILGKTFLETLKGLSKNSNKENGTRLSFLYAAELNKDTKEFISQYSAINSAGYELAQKCLHGYNPYWLYLRNPTDNFIEQLKQITTELEFSFIITDNLGGQSYFTPKIDRYFYELTGNGLIEVGNFDGQLSGNGFVSRGFSSCEYCINFEKGFNIPVLLAIPKNDISKYSKFDVKLRK